MGPLKWHECGECAETEPETCLESVNQKWVDTQAQNIYVAFFNRDINRDLVELGFPPKPFVEGETTFRVSIALNPASSYPIPPYPGREGILDITWNGETGEELLELAFGAARDAGHLEWTVDHTAQEVHLSWKDPQYRETLTRPSLSSNPLGDTPYTVEELYVYTEQDGADRWWSSQLVERFEEETQAVPCDPCAPPSDMPTPDDTEATQMVWEVEILSACELEDNQGQYNYDLDLPGYAYTCPLTTGEGFPFNSDNPIQAAQSLYNSYLNFGSSQPGLDYKYNGDNKVWLFLNPEEFCDISTYGEDYCQAIRDFCNGERDLQPSICYDQPAIDCGGEISVRFHCWNGTPPCEGGGDGPSIQPTSEHPVACYERGHESYCLPISGNDRLAIVSDVSHLELIDGEYDLDLETDCEVYAPGVGSASVKDGYLYTEVPSFPVASDEPACFSLAFNAGQGACSELQDVTVKSWSAVMGQVTEPDEFGLILSENLSVGDIVYFRIGQGGGGPSCSSSQFLPGYLENSLVWTDPSEDVYGFLQRLLDPLVGQGGFGYNIQVSTGQLIIRMSRDFAPSNQFAELCLQAPDGTSLGTRTSLYWTEQTRVDRVEVTVPCRTIRVCSSPLCVQPAACYTSVIRWNMNQRRNAFGADWDALGVSEKGLEFRTSLVLRDPTWPAETTIYEGSSGIVQTVYAAITKEWELETDYLPDEVHETLALAFHADKVSVQPDSFRAPLGVNLAEGYSPEAVEQYPYYNLRKARTKLRETPYRKVNPFC